MKDLIIAALNDAMTLLIKQIPQTKKKIKSIDISDISPSELTQFMKKNNIPDTVYFDGRNNSYDAWDIGTIVLSWEINVPTTDEDKLKFKKQRFSTIAWKFVYDILIKNGYKRKGYNSGLLKEFNDTTIYDMYINKDLNRLVKYYSLSFSK
ncbi:MAG: hypothetical protein ACOC33_03990 [bacterium]